MFLFKFEEIAPTGVQPSYLEPLRLFKPNDVVAKNVIQIGPAGARAWQTPTPDCRQRT